MRLTLNDHVNEKTAMAMKVVGLVQKLQYLLLLSSMLTNYKSFIRPHLNYGDVISDRLSNVTFIEFILLHFASVEAT